MTIRTETPRDADAIDRVTKAAFDTAGHASTEHLIVRGLREAGQLSISLVAEEHGAVIGHVAASPVSISDGSPDWYGLGPIAVEPERQGHGVGTALMNEALLALRARGAAGCVLVGAPAFYGRFGFSRLPGLVFPGVPAEFFLALVFAGRTPSPSGVVAYHDAFNAAG